MALMPPDPAEEAVVAEFAGQLFFRLWRVSHVQTAAAFESVGLTPALFALLNYLQSHENVIQQEIGAALGIDPSTMVALVDQLEDADLAKRRPRREDRRAREVVLTAKGRQTLERARELAKEVEGRVLHGLSPAERSQLVTLLRKAFAAAPPQPPWSFEEGD
jgi:MarR family transcriptional regulator, lower aerobic nicotinate degradation pathway regulator